MTREMDATAADAREVLEAAHVYRKIDLTSPQGWRSLEDLTISAEHGPKFTDTQLRRLNQLAARWFYLYRALDFSAATRPVWNS